MNPDQSPQKYQGEVRAQIEQAASVLSTPAGMTNALVGLLRIINPTEEFPDFADAKPRDVLELMDRLSFTLRHVVHDLESTGREAEAAKREAGKLRSILDQHGEEY